MFNYYPGNWKIPGTEVRLPEMSITESMGGNDASLYESIERRRASDGNESQYDTPAPATNSNEVYGPPAPSVLGVSTTSKTPTAKPRTSQAQQQTTNNESESDSDLLNSVDETYGDILGDVNRRRNELMASKGDFMKTFTSPYEQMVPQIQSALQQGLGAIDSARGGVRQQGENALDEARRLYNELNTRNKQMFGSAMGSSVGQAAGELLGREQMRSMGDIRQNVTNQIASLDEQARNLETEVQGRLQTIELQRQNAISQAELAFREQLDRLNDIEMQTKQNRSADRLNLLKQFREEVRAQNAQAQQFRQQVEMMAYQAQLSLSQNYAQVQQLADQAMQFGVGAQDQVGMQSANTMQGAEQANALGYGDSGYGFMDPMNLSGNLPRREDEALNALA